MCTLEDEENLSDHMVEIDILSEIKHRNIVELYEAFSLDDKLWVSNLVYIMPIFNSHHYDNLVSILNFFLFMLNRRVYNN